MADSPTPPLTPGPTPSVLVPGTRRTGLAVTTLVLGILGLAACAPAGIIAIVTGIVALYRIGRQPERHGGQGMAITGLVFGCVGLVFVLPLSVSILLPSLSRARELAKRMVCASNLKDIGTAMKVYANDLGVSPLIQAGYLTHQATVCPGSGLELSNYIIVHPPIGEPTGQELDNRAVLIYEPKSNHGEEGGNFLFADGHVEFVKDEEYDELVQALTNVPP